MKNLAYFIIFQLLILASIGFYLAGITLPFYFQSPPPITVFKLGDSLFWQFILSNNKLIASILGATLLYFLILLFLYHHGGKISKTNILVASFLLFLALLPTRQIFSSDIADYLFYGRMIAKYHQIPYYVSPSQFSSDPFYRRIGWKEEPVYHGPTALLIFSMASLIGLFFNFSFFTQVVLLKSIYSFFWLACLLVLIQLLAKLRSNRPQWWLAVIAFNPLLLIETAVNGHDDILMAFFILAAVLAYFHKKYFLSLISFLLALFVKYLPLIFLPVIFFSLFKHLSFVQIRQWFKGKVKRQNLNRHKLILLFIILALTGWFFYLQGDRFARFSGQFNDSLATLLFMWLERKKINSARLLANLLMKMMFIFLSIILVFRKPANNFKYLFTNITMFLWLFFLFFTSYFHPWYLTALLFITPLTQSLKEAIKYIVFSVSALFFYPVLAFVSSAGKYDPWSSQKIAILTIFGFQLVFLLREILGLRNGGYEVNS